jgi:hypothetical protein
MEALRILRLRPQLLARPLEAAHRRLVHTRATAAVSVDTEGELTRLEVEGSGRVAGFPYVDEFNFGGEMMNSDRVIQLLSPLVADGRMEKIERVISQRTYTVLPVVEGLYDMGNLAAVCRSAGKLDGLSGTHARRNAQILDATLLGSLQ